ncbi:MAG: hypothetical protein ACHQWH_03795 [Nitrososphaerales archaeon]|jgi:hypothetical protein
MKFNLSKEEVKSIIGEYIAERFDIALDEVIMFSDKKDDEILAVATTTKETK